MAEVYSRKNGVELNKSLYEKSKYLFCSENKTNTFFIKHKRIVSPKTNHCQLECDNV